MQSFIVPRLPVSLFVLALLPVLLPLLFFGCQQQASLETGFGLDRGTHTLAEPASIFQPNQPFSLVLRNADFRDSYLDLEIYHIRPSGKEVLVRNISLSNIDPDSDYLQIDRAFALPYPGRYRIIFSQLMEKLASTEVQIAAPGDPGYKDRQEY